MNIVYRRVHLSGILSKLGHFLLLKFSYDPATKPSSIYFVKRFLKCWSFQEIKASSASSCEANRGDKIILNIFGVAMYTKLISGMVLSTQQPLWGIAVLGDYRKFPGNYSRRSNFFKIGFSHEQSFLMFAKFPEWLSNSVNKLPLLDKTTL